jgi:hypothetical protein
LHPALGLRHHVNELPLDAVARLPRLDQVAAGGEELGTLPGLAAVPLDGPG